MNNTIMQDLHPCTCANPNCGKEFYVLDCLHYKYKGRDKMDSPIKYFCSYTCFRTWQKKKENSPRNLAIKKKIEMELRGGCNNPTGELPEAVEWNTAFTDKARRNGIPLKDIAEYLGIAYETMTGWRHQCYNKARAEKLDKALDELIERSKK